MIAGGSEHRSVPCLECPPKTASLPLLQQLHWLPVCKRVQFKISCTVHKALYNNGPLYLANKCNHYIASRTLRSGAKSLHLVPWVRKSRLGGKAFSYLAPLYWNQLPIHLRQCPDYLRFRKLLKTVLF